MSSTLHWRPTNHEGAHLGYELKFVLRQRVDDLSSWVELNGNDLQYLEGVAVGARMKDRGELEEEVRVVIGLIKKHGAIEVREVH